MTNETIKLASIEVNNCKKIDVVSITPEGESLIVGGANMQGKTSLLDIIEWGLRGNKCKPSQLKNTNSVGDPSVKMGFTNGFSIDRTDKRLKIIDKNGRATKNGQKYLDEIFSSFALSLPDFMKANSKDKCRIMLDAIGPDLAVKVAEFEQTIETYMEARKEVNRDVKRLDGALETMAPYVEAPEELISIEELANKQKEVINHNTNIQGAITSHITSCFEIMDLDQKIQQLTIEYQAKCKSLETLKAEILKVKPIDSIEINKQIEDYEIINDRIRANQNRNKVEMERGDYHLKSGEYTELIEKARADKIALLESVDMPLPGMSVESGELILNCQKWDCMSTSEQFIASASIVSRIKPNHKFILLDQLETLDQESMQEFLQWANSVDLQVIATRVSEGNECNIIIKAGRVIKDTVSKVVGKLGF